MATKPDLGEALHRLFGDVAACRTLWQSRDAFINGLLALLDDKKNSPDNIAAALRGLTSHPDDENRQIAWHALLGEALTRNTSHVAVDPRHPGYAKAHRMLTETPELDKAAHIADLERRLDAKDAQHRQALAELDTEKSKHAELKRNVDKMLATPKAKA